MANKKGSPKTGGRKAGTPNKVTASQKEWIAELMTANRERFEAALKRLDDGDFVKNYLALLPYVVGKVEAAPAPPLLAGDWQEPERPYKLNFHFEDK